MEIVIDPDVQAVAEFMQRNVPAARLASVAKALNELGPLLWGASAATPKETVRAICLREIAPV